MFLLSKRVKTFAVFLLLLIAADIILRLLFFDSDPILTAVYFIFDYYLLLAERFATLLLDLSGSSIIVKDHLSFLDDKQLKDFSPSVLYEKWVLFLLCFFWLSDTTYRSKLIYTIIIIILDYLFVSVNIALRAYFAQPQFSNNYIIALSMTLGALSMATVLFVWYRRNQESILNSLSRLKIDTDLLKNRFFSVVLITYVAVVTMHFILDSFDFRLWIKFVFTSAQMILGLMGFEAIVEPFLLVGENGSISMAKGCMGYDTMFLFASVVFLTGYGINRLIYIILGILLLNLANIMRFVLLFIHIQRHGDYVSAMNLHDIYNLFLYAIVFLLWVLWFYKYSDVKSAR